MPTLAQKVLPWPDKPATWLDATKAGDLRAYPTPDGQGVVITEETIDQLVQNFGAVTDLIPIDGAGLTPVHGTVDDSGLPAIGWVVDAEKRLDANQVPHLWLQVQAVPEVQAMLDAKQVLYGSVAFDPAGVDHVTNAPIGAKLHSYALTNKPFRTGLQPHGLRARPAPCYMMSTQVRLGPAMDLRAQLFQLLKIDPAEALNDPDASWKIRDRVDAIMNAAQVEEITTPGVPAPSSPQASPQTAPNAMSTRSPTMPTPNARLRTRQPQPAQAPRLNLAALAAGFDIPALRALLKIDPSIPDDKAMEAIVAAITKAQAAGVPAVPGVPGPGVPAGANVPQGPAAGAATLAVPSPMDGMTPEQCMAMLTDAVTTIGNIFGQPDIQPAAAIDLLKASTDLLSGAAKAATSGGTAGTSPVPGAQTMSDKQIKAQILQFAQGLGSTDPVALATEVRELRGFKARNIALEFVLDEADKRQIELTAERADRLTKIVLAVPDGGGRALVIDALDVEARPKPGVVLGGRHQVIASPEANEERAALIQKFEDTVRKEWPTSTAYEVFREAQARASVKRPDLFGRATDR